MSIENDARFWDRSARKYAKAAVGDQAGYERTLARTHALLNSGDRVLELGCGSGTTAFRLAHAVRRYLATDISPGMIEIAKEKEADSPPSSALAFRTATAEHLAQETERFDAVLGLNYLHLVRDLQGTLRCIHALLVDGGLFVSKTPCLGDMNPLIRWVLVPALRAIGKAPYAAAFREDDLTRHLATAGFDILAVEDHATKGKEARPYIVARKRAGPDQGP